MQMTILNSHLLSFPILAGIQGHL